MRQTIISLVLFIAAGAPAALGDSWSAEPIVVHEWGVEEFDWSGGTTTALSSDLPGYMYTNAHPGMPGPLMAKKAKDYPPDSGMRAKPILYFYPDPSGAFSQKIPIGVELRFAQGHATAWYPQVNVYRPQAVAAAGQAMDVQAWEHGKGPFKAVPDDTRMQLAWYSLTLTKEDPFAAPEPGADLPKDHWTKLARQVPNAAYVSNGTQAEKYLFYEGGTYEQPAIAIVPKYGTRFISPPTGQIVNISDQTIYNVFAVYHAGGRTWVGYVSSLETMKSAAASASGRVTVPTLPMPDFTGAVPWTDPQALHDATTSRLLSALTEGGALTATGRELRIPAEPQGPTTCSHLFPEEAAALEKIWRHDFFDPGAADGLTVVYRQSPAQLDADMPLDLYTDMYHYFSLSRCGLVVVRNIDVNLAFKTDEQVVRAGATGLTFNAKVRSNALAFLHQHRALALSALGLDQKETDALRCRELRQQIESR